MVYLGDYWAEITWSLGLRFYQKQITGNINAG